MNENVQSLLPAEWREAFHIRKAQSVREILCVLYVAMTRARQALYVITSPRTAKSDTASQSCEAIVQSTLSEKELYKKPETVLYERGAADWFSVPARDQVSELAASTSQTRIALATDGQSAPPRGYRVAAPSSIAAMSSVDFASIFTVSQSVGAAIVR